MELGQGNSKLMEIEREIKELSDKWRPTSALIYYTWHHGLFAPQFKNISAWIIVLAKKIGQHETWAYQQKGAGAFLFDEICTYLNIPFDPKNKANLIEVLNNNFPYASVKTVYVASLCFQKYVELGQKHEGLELGVEVARGNRTRRELEELNKLLGKRIKEGKGEIPKVESVSEGFETEGDGRQGASSGSSASVGMSDVKEACTKIGIDPVKGLRFLKELKITILA